MTARLSATVLVLEALLVFFLTLVEATLLPRSTGYSTGQVWTAGLVMVVVCVLVAGVVRRPGGLVVGAVLQVLLIATGVFLPVMYGVGVVFAALFAWLVSIGRRIDRDRRRWAEQEARAQQGAGGAADG
jgi:hypothetical protein